MSSILYIAYIDQLHTTVWGTRWRSVRHCATSLKVAGSIPDDVILPDRLILLQK